MLAHRYEVRARVVIDAPVSRVYRIATDPLLVPRYASEVSRIEILSRDETRGTADVRSHLRLFGRAIACDYRYRYRADSFYGGVQQGGRMVRGYFAMRFSSTGAGTMVEHSEGIISRVPGLARALGWLYFRLLGHDDLAEELDRLRRIVEEVAGR